MKRVEIFWQDSASCGLNLHSLEEAINHHSAKWSTLGYLLRRDKKEVVLAMSHAGAAEFPDNAIEGAEEGFKFIWVIPKGCIERIITLEEKL